eukprot:CAMPEP_0201565072 /NCGR_PEP_ID=MMETSP0190_2-20130828/3896_1 /ASSEMBLY_ACC=CAM_ASM_000263 /TAXON_ID=37353 /ORGANISM="Rosalina sp." /LENGTH=617 /DNA_ID=CAMNT_0047982091 /DNA_START=32 /DNA_END=1882 /DNA_ORIENTATION=-
MAQPKESMDVDQSNDNNQNKKEENNSNKKSDEPEYELSVQLAMHSNPARCVVAIDDDTIVSGGRKDGEFILWKRMQQPSQTTNTENNDNDKDKEDKDKTKDDDNDEKMKDIKDTSAIKFDGSIIFTEDKFHPLVFCAVKHKIKAEPARIVSGGNDQRAIIWDIDGNIIQQLGAHSNSINSVDVTNDGQVLTGSYDSTAKIWGVDGNCVATLKGHQHGVEVCSLESGEIVTGTFKIFNIWSATGELIKKVEFAHDHMIRKVRRHPLGFLTCGNDGYVNLWSNKGESLRKVLAHPENGDIPSFVYGLYCMDNGDWLSCGEDGTVKIFSGDGYLQQQLRHPGAVWDISMLPNGDIVSACADGAIRVWSKDVTRQADAEAIKEYYNALTMAASAQGGGGGSDAVDPNQLEPAEVLNHPGKPGEFKMVNDPKKGPSVYQWDGATMQWQYIGEIMGKPGGGNKKQQPRSAGNKPMIDGIAYDYVTHIDINGDDVQVPLGFNKDDDPRQIARDFCVIHSLDLDLAKKIEDHLKPMQDPVARAARVERERIAASKQLKHIPSYIQCGYEIQSKLKLDAMKKKINELNAEILKDDDNKDNNYKQYGIEDSADLDDLFGILADQTVW